MELKKIYTTKLKDMNNEEKLTAKKVYQYSNGLIFYYKDIAEARKKNKAYTKNMTLINNTEKDIIDIVGITTNDLSKLSKEWQENNGADTDFTRNITSKINELMTLKKQNPNKSKLPIIIITTIIIIFILSRLISGGDSNPAPVTNATYNNYISNKKGLISDINNDPIITPIINSSSFIKNGIKNIDINPNLSTNNNKDFNVTLDIIVNAATLKDSIDTASNILSNLPKNLDYAKISITLFNPNVSKDLQLIHFSINKDILINTNWSNISAEAFKNKVNDFVSYLN